MSPVLADHGIGFLNPPYGRLARSTIAGRFFINWIFLFLNLAAPLD